MFYRICRFLTLNIQLVFVFDGPSRPWKRGKRGGGKIDYPERDILKEVLRHFGIPYHEAPGEAEAECARMQILGLVDAVWSQDSDCLMFGCTLWIRDDRVVKVKGEQDRSKENTEKSKKTARVVRAKDLKDRLAIDREGLVLFAMLVGGDYDTKGLPGCGPSIALQAVGQGIGQSLCLCQSQRDCSTWSMQLAEFLRTNSRGRSLDVPMAFPDFKTLQKYYSPKVSSDEVLLNNAKLNLDYVRPIHELKLLEATGAHFNMWGKFYMNWVGPILLTRYLSSKEISSPRELVHDIRLTKRRVKKSDNALPVRVLERKLTFSPFGVSSLSKKDFEGDRSGYWIGAKDVPFDPEHRVECELPEYWLRKILPLDVLEPPSPAPKQRATKRKQSAATTEQAEPLFTTKRKRIAGKRADPSCPRRDSTSVTAEKLKHNVPKKRSAKPPKTGRQHASAVRGMVVITLSDSEDDMEHRSPPRLHSPSSARSIVSQIIDFSSPLTSDSDEELFGIEQYTNTPSRAPPPQSASLAGLVDDDERDFQLALELSMREEIEPRPSPQIAHGASPLMYQLPTGGDARNFSALAVPVAYQSYGVRHTISETFSSEPRISSNTKRNNTINHTIIAATPERSYGSPCVPSKHAHPKFSMAGLENVSSNNTSSQPATIPTAAPATLTPDAVRAARLRHFANSSNASNLISAQRAPATGFSVPVGAACIDLTDD